MLVIALGVVVSLLWCWAGWYYLEQAVGFENLLLLLPHEIGQFAVGFFTPLFLLWILVALVVLLRRTRRLAAPAASQDGGRKRDPQLETPPLAKPTGETPKPSTAKTPDADGKTKGESEAEPSSRAAARASVRATDAAGKVTIEKVEESSAKGGDGPATASAKAVGRSNSGAPPPRRPDSAATEPPTATAAGGVDGELPPKRPSEAQQAEAAAAEAKDAPAKTPPGPLPPKRPSEENIAPLPRGADGPRPPKSPKTIVENYAEAQGHTVKELNAIVMDAAALLCPPEAYQASRDAFNRGQEDSFFELLDETLASDAEAALGELRKNGSAELLETYRAKFHSLLRAAEQEPEAESLLRHLKSSAQGRLYETIENKL